MDRRREWYHEDREPWWSREEREAERDTRYAGDYDLRSYGRDFGEREYRRDTGDYGGYSPYSPYREGYRGYEGEPYYGAFGYQGYPSWRSRYGPPPYGGEYDGGETSGFRRSPPPGAYGREPEPERARQSAARRFPRGPKGYTRSDTRIQEDISDTLYESDEIDSSDVTVNVSQGKAILDGTVPERWMKHAIENVADQCLGVRDVENNIRVKQTAENVQGPGPRAEQGGRRTSAMR